MVRLRAIQYNAAKAAVKKFQFQYGAIKRGIAQGAMTLLGEFQFQYGAIKSFKNLIVNNFKTNFNSNMVRLRA